MQQSAATAMLRRAFIATITAAATALFAGRPSGAAPPRPLHADAARLLEAFRQRESAAAVGRAYLATRPEERDAPRLAGAVSRDLRDGGCDPATGDRADLRRAVSGRVRQDFADGRTVTVDGWVLSRTEARLCALAALAPA